jgi:DNA helicase II / ATP-dependent DNA helicase PcrA
MAARFEQIAWPEAPATAPAAGLQPQAPMIQVRARSRAAWK